MYRPHRKNGFTIVELMLAMTFLSALLVIIAMTVIRVGNIYNRGLTIKDVNQAGRSIIRDLQESVSQSRSFNISVNYVNKDFGGRLCLGQYSYIWNYSRTLLLAPALVDKAHSNVDKNNKMMRFIKVPDNTGKYCSTPDLEIDTGSGVQNLLGTDDLTLAMYDFSITNSAIDSKTLQGLYYISFTVGTDNAAVVDATAKSCTPDSAGQLDINYCSINQFNMVVRAGNEVQ